MENNESELAFRSQFWAHGAGWITLLPYGISASASIFLFGAIPDAVR